MPGDGVISVGTLIAVHGLWEQALDRSLREQAIMFNLVTLITAGFGIAVLYTTLCLLELAAAWLLINPSLFSAQIGHASGLGDYLRLALLAGALATLGEPSGRRWRATQPCARPRTATGAPRRCRNRFIATELAS